MNQHTQLNISIIKDKMRCSTDETFKYLDYKNLINRDCMGNIKEFLPKIVYPHDSTASYEKFKNTYKYLR